MQWHVRFDRFVQQSHPADLTMGQVIGETDSRAERSIYGQISFQNSMSTIYHVLGIDLDVTLPDFNGRPQYLLDDRQPIRDLLA